MMKDCEPPTRARQRMLRLWHHLHPRRPSVRRCVEGGVIRRIFPLATEFIAYWQGRSVVAAVRSEERLLVDGLHRPGDVAVPIEQGIFWATAWAEKFLERGREQIAKFPRS